VCALRVGELDEARSRMPFRCADATVFVGDRCHPAAPGLMPAGQTLTLAVRGSLMTASADVFWGIYAPPTFSQKATIPFSPVYSE